MGRAKQVSVCGTAVFERLSIRPSSKQQHGDVAQLGERRLCKPEVVGSNPIVSS